MITKLWKYFILSNLKIDVFSTYSIGKDFYTASSCCGSGKLEPCGMTRFKDKYVEMHQDNKFHPGIPLPRFTLKTHWECWQKAWYEAD